MQYTQINIETEVQGFIFESNYKQPLSLGCTAIFKVEDDNEDEDEDTKSENFRGKPKIFEGGISCNDVEIVEKE
ncbi:hypothetical protein [Lysinibacillus xylanilyticus]|uniref:Uncharacterized protein n=1 Tax=Lysinibacillus xylanilyticus TaxID=582475 RepID=A0A2M9Q5M9_9BACI|nr:hypothetical protein [Lysinibacillus xylanilyticus]PJO43389.1 hypothetical protein CWD94_12615 [Lysinibacillus xylanilyticus]